MSIAPAKSLILSQPKSGQGEALTPPSLKQTTTTVDNDTIISIEIPGVDPSTVDVKFDGGTLLVDCPRGSAIIPLHPTCDTAAINAEILWGMLTLTIPMPSAPVAHSIKVNIHDTVKKTTSKRFTDGE